MANSYVKNAPPASTGKSLGRLSVQIEAGLFAALRALRFGGPAAIDAAQAEDLKALGLVAPAGGGWRVTAAGMTRLRSFPQGS